MHACGHDVHMTCGLGILEQILSRPQRNSFVFFFQPAEENISGAKQICDAGLLDKYRIGEFYALHVSPEWDAGVIATRPGTLLAGSSSVTVQFNGVAGHAGMPHRAVDPIVSVAAFIMQIQAMIARNFDPGVGGVVLTFGTGPKEFDWIDGASHVDLYDREQYVGPAVEKLARFFGDNLGQAA
jgi:N-acetyldiaminopimelate deacetylase